MMDVIFLSSNEPNSEDNYRNACTVLQRTLKRVSGQGTTLAGFKEAARLSDSDLFILIDGDNHVYPQAKEVLESVDRPSVFQAKNYLGMSYGHGGIKVLSKSTNWDDFETPYLDISSRLNLDARRECLSEHQFHLTHFLHYKTVFKELLKLHLKKESGVIYKEYLNKWLKDKYCKSVYEDVLNFLRHANFDDLTLIRLNQKIREIFADKFDIVLVAILGNDRKWIDRFLENIEGFNKAFILDTGSRDGSWKELKRIVKNYPQLKIKRKFYWKKDFSNFRNDCLKFAKENLGENSIFVIVDFDEKIADLDLSNLRDEVLFSDNIGARFEVLRDEWHGAITPLARVFIDSKGRWEAPIHETFLYEEAHYNALNRLSSLRLTHLRSDEDDLNLKGKRDLKILMKHVNSNPKRYLYFIFESYNKMENHEKIISEFKKWRGTIMSDLDLHYQLLIHKYVISAYSEIGKKCDESLIHFMKSYRSRSVYFQLIKGLMKFGPNRSLCRKLWTEMEEIPENREELIYIAEAYDDNEVNRIKRNIMEESH